MILLRFVRRVSIALLPIACVPLAALAQAQPTSLSSSTSLIYQGIPGSYGANNCYTLTAGNGANMTLDVRYTFNGAPQADLFGWPALNASGVSTPAICSDINGSAGLYRITGIRNTLTPGASYVNVNVPITIAPIPPQPNSLTFNGSTSAQGHAGNHSYTLHAGNAANMTINAEYRINGVPQGVWTQALDASGGWFHTLNHYATTGIYQFTRIKNALRNDWFTIDSSYTVKPPMPTWASAAPSSVRAGQGSYVFTAGNGANMALDVKYTFNSGSGEGPLIPLYGWPVLSPVSSGSADGQASIPVGPCSLPGIYTFRSMKNSLNSDSTWVTVNAAVTVLAPHAPVVSSTVPASAAAAASGTITINGTNLCAVTLAATPGLSFGTVVQDPNGVSVSAPFTVASGAVPGQAAVMLSATGGTTTFPFNVSNSVPPAVTGLSPASAVPGTNVTVTIAGTNLGGGLLSTVPLYPGLTFDNYSYNGAGTSMSARFTVAASASLGTPNIRVTTPAGFAATTLFSITASPPGGGISSIREYIYLGDRVIAVETTGSVPPSNPPPDTVPPTAPVVTGLAVSPNTVLLTWDASTDNPGGAGVGSYDVKRGGAVLYNLAAPASSQISYLDTTAAASTAYQYTIVARDKASPVNVSSNSNIAAVTTPPETVAPTTPVLEDAQWWEDPPGVWTLYLSWQPSIDSGGSGLAGYYVTYGHEQGDWFGLIENTSVALPFDLEFDWPSFEYIEVRAVDHAGNLSSPAVYTFQ